LDDLDNVEKNEKKICPSCGYENDPEVRVCIMDGTPLDPEAEAADQCPAAETSADELSGGGSLRELVEEAEQTQEDLDGALAPEETGTPKEIHKGPSVVAWLIAALMGVLCLVALLFDVGIKGGYVSLALPALRGMWYESGKRMYSAVDCYETLRVRAQEVEQWRKEKFRLGGGSSGQLLTEQQDSSTIYSADRFYYERTLLAAAKINPLDVIRQNSYGQSYLDSWFPEDAYRPRAVRRLAAQVAPLLKVEESFSTAYQAYYEAHPELEEAPPYEAVVDLLRKTKEGDKDASHAIFYDYYLLLITANDPDQKETAAKVLEELKKTPGVKPWMYLDTQLQLAQASADYGAILEACKERLKTNKEDPVALESEIRALYLQGKTDEASAKAKSLAALHNSQLAEAGKLMQAELLSRGGKYDEALAICDKIIAADEPTQSVLTASILKAKALLLKGDNQTALDTLQKLYDDPNWQQQITQEFVYTMMAASIRAQNTEVYAELAEMLESYDMAIPTQITQLEKGKVTVQDLYGKGWGDIT
jgi:tetratricopeptide (TPR) repeat protein